MISFLKFECSSRFKLQISDGSTTTHLSISLALKFPFSKKNERNSSKKLRYLMQSREVYAPQADVLATSSGCRLLDRDTFVLDNDAGGGEGDEDEFLSLLGDRVTRDDAAA